MPVSVSNSSSSGSVLPMLPRAPSMIIFDDHLARGRVALIIFSALVTNIVADQFGGKG